jgi:glycosyltransferase involved in cell wall biosynthesis
LEYSRHDEEELGCRGKMNILILPSWYPTFDGPLNGSFIREQSALTDIEHSVRVLFPRILGRQDFWKLLQRDSADLSKYQPISPPEAEAFFFVALQKLSKKLQIKNAIQSGERSLEELMNSGWKPDVIHAHVTFDAGIYATALGEKYGIPVMITEHSGPFLLDKYSKYVRELVKCSLETAQLVATLSNHQSRALLSHGLKIRPIIVGEMIDDASFNIEPKSDLKDRFVILTVSGSQFYKDLDTFLQALLILKEKGIKNFLARIVSISDISAVHRTFIDENQLHEYCDLRIGTSREEMPELFANCDVMVSTSIAETFGIAMGEALATGRPVIATRSGGPEDFIIDGINGYLVNIQDAVGLALKIIECMQGRIKTSPEEIRETIVGSYGREAFKSRLHRLYDLIIQRG